MSGRLPAKGLARLSGNVLWFVVGRFCRASEFRFSDFEFRASMGL